MLTVLNSKSREARGSESQFSQATWMNGARERMEIQGNKKGGISFFFFAKPYHNTRLRQWRSLVVSSLSNLESSKTMH